MSIWLIGLAVYLVWLALGIRYLIYNIGNKEPWYAWVIMSPIFTILLIILPILIIFIFIAYLSELSDRFSRK
jgi:hypothetical protein